MATVDEVFALDLDVKAAVLGRLMEIMEERQGANAGCAMGGDIRNDR